MFLLLGDPRDPWCTALRSELSSRGKQSRITNNPFADGSLSWRISGGRSTSRFRLASDEINDTDLSGVFVRSSGWVDATGWKAEDHRYVQTETQAALLGWLWSLDCPVVNRYNSWVWYHPNKPVLLWFQLLRSCGLPTPARLITNVESAAREFSEPAADAADRHPVAVYAPLTSTVHYLIQDREWDRLAALFRVTPGQISHPHGEANVACIVGAQDIIWGSKPPRQLKSFEPAMREFARRAGLDFLELAFAEENGRPVVVTVEAFPRFEHFGPGARKSIARGLAELITTAPHGRSYKEPNYGGTR